MAKRKTELSMMNIIMCLLVIFVHIASWTIGSMDKESVKYIFLLVPWRLSAFVVQGFLFLSGVKLFSAAKPFSYGRFLFGRLIKICLPYLLWVGVYYAYFIGIGWYTFSWSDLAEYVFLGTLCSHFYYIIIAMQFYLLMPFWRFLLDRVPAWLLCGVSVLITAWVKRFVHFQYDDRVFFSYLCYFVVGAVVGRNYDKVCAFCKRFVWLLCGAFSTLGFADAWLTYRSQVHGAVYPWFEVLHLCYCFAAILSLFSVGLWLCENRTLPRFVSLCDRASYGMYLSHVLFIYIANALLHRAGITDLLYTFVLRGIFTYAATIALCALYTFVKEKFFHGKQTARTV